MDTDRLPPFGAQFSLGGFVHSLAGRDGILWCGSRFLPTSSGVKTKKEAILGFVWPFTSVSRPGTRLYSRLRGGAQAVFLGGTGSEMHSSGTGLVTVFWSTILAWGHNQ